MKNYVPYIICSLLFLCSFPGCDRPEPAPATTDVVLIFRDVPKQSSREGVLSGSESLADPDMIIGYMDTDTSLRYYNPRSIGYDTLNVPSFNGIAEITHTYMVSETVRYLLKAGDTVMFSYDTISRPRAASLSSEANTRLYNVAFDSPGFLAANGYSAASILANSQYAMIYRSVKGLDKRPVSAELAAEIRKAYIDLDSLEAVYEKYVDGLHKRLDSLSGEDARWRDFYMMKEYSDRLSFNYSSKAGDAPYDKKDFYGRFANDSLSYLMIYRHTLDKLVPKLYDVPQALPYKEKCTALFDSISNDALMPRATKAAALKTYTDRIVEQLPYTEAVRYMERYSSATGKFFENKPAFSKPNIISGGYSNDLVLTDIKGDTISYADMLEALHGKVIYIDFWASWCGPCKAKMPAAKELRQAYKGKDIAFVYLALNDTPGAWRKAVRNHETDLLGCNYFIVNSDDARFLKELKLYGIPFTIIYDKKGRLVDIDAPHPDSSNIVEVLDGML